MTFEAVEIEAKSLFRRSRRIDSWFVAAGGMNLYRGCTHNCAYCDGRAEKYRVEGEFGQRVEVKVNAPTLLSRELDPTRKRKPFRGGFVLLGGGVNDAYQPLEKTYELSRRALELALRFGHPVHVLTKSPLVLRDLDLLRQINARSRALVSFSFSSVDRALCARFEPGVPPPARRLEALRQLHDAGVLGGVYLMPVLPGLSDSIEQLSASFSAIEKTGARFVIFGGMTLKGGRQEEHFYRVLSKQDPTLVAHYQRIYRGHKYGEADGRYYNRLNQRLRAVAQKHKLPLRIPKSLFDDLLDENDRIVVLLEHIDYWLKLKNAQSNYGRAAYSIVKLKQAISQYPGPLTELDYVNSTIARVIDDIVKTGTSPLYQRLAAVS